MLKKYKWVCLGVITAAVVLGGCYQKAALPPNPTGVRQELTIGTAKVMAEVRNDPAGRELGLSYRTTLGENEGMLFVFDQADRYSFWMLGMQFPLDMIWIKEGKVVDISAEVPAPKTSQETPATAQPKESADKVLEVNGGWAERHGVKIGDVVGR